jgi:hypothetical protein
MRGKALLKRLFYGRLAEFPSELLPSHGAADTPAVLTGPADAGRFKVIYAVGELP